jgi:hypothetical protein
MCCFLFQRPLSIFPLFLQQQLNALHFIMSALSFNVQRFSTFHSCTRAHPNEITSHIITYVNADTQPSPLGGGVNMRKAHQPVASVSRALRMIYLNHPYRPAVARAQKAPISLSIGEALYFSDLQTLAAFFQAGPGRNGAFLQTVRFISISYLDDHAANDWWRRTTDYAYEAFELLYSHWRLMRVYWLQLCFPYVHTVSSVDDPGIWSLLKIRGLAHLTILGPRGCLAPKVRASLKSQTHKKALFPWRPLGVENPGPGNWMTLIKHQEDPSRWQEQYDWLNARYKYLHDRMTVATRRVMQRAAYRKHRRRWPMLKNRRRGRVCILEGRRE